MNRRDRGRRGTAILETGLVLLPMMMMIFAVITFSHAVYVYNSISFAARQGTRYCSVRGSSSGHPATDTQVRDYVRSQVVGMDKSAVNVNVVWTPNQNPGSDVSVTVSYSFAPIIPILLTSPFSTSSTSTNVVLQ